MIEEELVTEEEIVAEEVIEETSFLDSTKTYKKKLIMKLSIVFVCSIIILSTRLFDKYVPFDIIMNSILFLALLVVAVVFGIASVVYLIATTNEMSKENTNKIYKKLLSGFDLISVVPIFIAVLSISNAFFISPATVIGQSMEPNYYEGQDILMWHLTTDYERFDVVVLRTENDEYYIKRIIGLPGETIKISNNKVSVNGVIIEQDFITDEDGSILANTYCYNDPDQSCIFNVPSESYFVLGDNREHSLDSRSNLLGFVHEDSVYGTVVAKFNNIFRNGTN